MIVLRQKEFNSKAAKALNTKYLKRYAIDHEISKIMRSVNESITPEAIKKNARARNKYSTDGILSINERINNRSHGICASSVDPGSTRNRAIRNKNHPFRKEYDHGPEKTIFNNTDSIKSIVANNPWTGAVDQTRRELKRLRAAAKN